jgi:two-component system, OmpR family, sensor histidine kinase KdpD
MTDDKALSFLRLIRRSQRGKLKIYLGYGAGVGKTWQMLKEGHRLRKEGVEAVVGLVETHGRKETAELIEGLEVIPRRQLQYRGITLDEMDLEAVLARRPEVALVDELAHTNVPGSKNPKRYQDVEDLLAAGIHVISTLNIQHLESLYDIVETHIGVKVHERIPDSVLAEADEIVNVDVAPEDLLQRLREGKIYPTERVGVALENFFRRVNLDQLRELTLRELAAQIDLKRRTEPEAEHDVAPDQVMVCLSSRGPNTAAMLRYASRLAGRLNTNWYAVYVQTPREEPTAIDAAIQRQLADTLTLAKQLGAQVFPYKGEDVVETILHFAREYRVGHIVIGKPGLLPAWKRWLGRKTLAEQLILKARGVNIVVVDTESKTENEPLQ